MPLNSVGKADQNPEQKPGLGLRDHFPQGPLGPAPLTVLGAWKDRLRDSVHLSPEAQLS